VTNLAARLCAEAAGGQILVSQRVHAAVEAQVEADDLGTFEFKGFARSLPAFNVVRIVEAASPAP